MKNYYTNLNQLRQSNDGQPTVNRQSRLMLRQGWFRNLAMIFAVLVLSMANVGTAWGAETVLFSSFANTTASNYFKSYTVDGKTVTVAASSTTISSSSGDYFCSMMGSTSKDNGNNYVELTVTGATIKTVSVLITGNGENKTCQPALLGWEGAIASTTTADYVLVPASQKISNKGVANAKWHQFDVHGNDLTRVRIYRAVKGVNVAGESTSGTTYGNAQTLQFYGIRVELEVDGVTKPTFSPATGSSLVKSTGAVTLTSSGNTVYYKWNQTDNQYASGAGATLESAADGSGTSPVNATAPSTAGTWYLYAVAKKGGDYSNVVKATYTITNPTHTLTWTLDGGTATGGTAAGAVAEGATLTAPTVTKVGYDFAGWSPTVPATMPAADATYIATWTKVYASGTYTFENNAALGTLPNKLTMTNGSDVAVAAGSRIDNLFFSAMTIRYENGTYSGAGDDFKGWKIKTDAATIKFFVENDCDVTIGVGNLTSGATITYTNQSGTVKENQSLTAKQDNTYSVKGGTMVTFKTSGGSTVTLKKIQIGSSCTAPSSVGISGEWRYFPGQTISLTATPTGHTGTPTYQWQKEISADNWQNISNGTEAGVTISGATTNNLQITPCGTGNTGKYRCVVSTGATCSTNSDPFSVKIFTLNGAYDDGEFSSNNITFTSGTTGTATVHLAAGRVYKFKVTDNFGMWFGNSGRILEPAGNWTFPSNNSTNCVLFTGPEGDYTFTVDIDHVTYGTPEVVVSVAYPDVTHPSAGYAYFRNVDNWTNVGLYMWYEGGGSYTDWGSEPWVTRTTTICGNTYYYTPLIPSWYNRAIFREVGGSGQTGNIEYANLAAYSGKYNDKSDANWHEFTTYSITYAANGGGGSMSATSGLCPDADQAITSNAFTAPTGCASFAHWTANVAVKVGGETVPTGNPIANEATIQNINSDITLTAVWKLTKPDITDNEDNTFSISGSIGGASYYYTIDGSTPTTSSSLYSTAVDFSAGADNITAKAIAHKTGYVDSDPASQACTYHAAASLTALECNTLYKVEDMVASTITSITSTEQFAAGLSSNTKFEVLGTGTVNATGGPMAAKNDAATISGTSFTNSLYFKGAGNKSGEIPTSRGIKFIVPNAGKLDIYVKGPGGINIVKDGGTGSAIGSGDSNAKVTVDVTAGTYYLYATASSRTLFGIQLNCCSTPAAPTAFAAGSITSTGATFSITDAANAASYDIYYSTSSSAPAASAAATTTSDSKTKAVTGLTASTTYYAWVRSVCDADHKSTWVALTSPTAKFTTSAAAALNDGCWDPANTAADKLVSKDVSLTPFESNFSGVTGITSVTIQSKGTGSSGQCSGADETTPSGYMKVKDASSSGVKIITIVTSAAKDITIGGQNYNSNTGSFYLVKSTAESTKLAECNTGKTAKATNCPAGTYYVYAKASTKSINFSLLCIEDAASDVTAPTFVSSVPANGATGVATSGTIVLTFSEALGSVDASKFTLTGASKGAVAIDGSDATKVNIPYSGAANSATVTLATDAAAVSDLAGNALAAALTNISFTTAAAAPAGDCDELVVVTATSKTAVTATVGSVVSASLSEGNSFSDIDGYTFAVKPGSSGTLTLSPKAGSSFAAGDSLIFIVHNGNSGSKTEGFKIGSTVYTHSVAGNSLYYFRQLLTAENIVDGKVQIKRNGSDDRWVGVIIKHCGLLPSCTTPVIPTLSNQSLCEGGNATAWNATITNSLATGETVAYSWVKKGSSTVLSSTATYQPTSVTEAMAGTYVVTVTVSKAGYASSTATKEVTLSVTEGIEVTGITADKATVYPTNSVTLTATASADATWQWYTCSNAEGASESRIDDATSASYTIASAGSAGTYYYKVEATGSCGTDEMVYTLTVSAAAGGDCETEFWFAKAADKPESATAATHITGTPSGSSSATYTATIDGNSYPITGQTGQKTGNVTIVVPENNEGTLYVVVQGSSSRTITLSKGGVQVGQYTPANSTWGTFTFSSLDAGTYTLVSSGNIGWGIIALKLCSGTACTDPEVTASVNNSTACVGSSVTFTATGAHASATYQWQKYSGGAWTDIASATAATYNIASVATTDALKYRVIATKYCDRTSNEVTLNVPVAPVFGSFTATRSVMATQALSITDVEASDATSYAWYKSADATYDAGTDTRVGTAQELLLASGGEAAGATYYLFCVASNACGSTTSSAITVNVTAFIEEDCATRGTEGAAEFGFQNSGCSQSTYNGTAVWSTGTSNSKILIYSAPDGKYFKTMKVTIASSSASQASYNWSTDGGTHYTSDGVAITGVTTTLTEKTINLSAHGNVNEVKIGRNFGNGESSGTLYVSKICFEYTSACTTTTVTPSGTGSETHTIGGSSFTEPTFTVKHGGTAFDPQPEITYTSSNEDIASVDDDGTVTFNGEAGTVTITASYAGGTISATDYCASSGSYTITVSCPGGAPKVVASGSVDMSGCNSSVTLLAKQSDGKSDFADGTYQWFRNGEEIDGETGSSYTATQAGTYTVERTKDGCTSPSSNSAVVTSETTEPEVERLVPFQYYHVDKTYSDQMKMRHLFAVKNSGKLDGKSFKMYVSRNGGAATDVTGSNALVVWPSGDGHVDTVMVDLNKLSGKYTEGDELVFTCKAIDCTPAVSEVYKNTITMNVIGTTPTLALICSGSSKAGGTRKTGELTVGGDFLTGYNVADLCQQTGNTSFNANIEWGLYTDLKTHYIVTPVNGYAVFNRLNYEPFDILLLTDYPKASKSDAAADVLDDMAALCDYRPMLSFKTHMVAKSPSKWAAKGFTTSPVVSKADGRLNLNIVCYAHPMFASLTEGADVYKDNGDLSQLVYTMLSEPGYESSKGMQGFEIAAAENFVTIGLTHYNGTIAKNSPSTGKVTWTPNDGDRMLVTVAERQTNTEARFILFSINCGAQSKLTAKGEEVILACLEYLLDDDPLHVADCALTFDNGAGNTTYDAGTYAGSGVKGDGKWSTEANWGPQYLNIPGEFNSARIAAPVTVDIEHAKAMELRIVNEGSINIPTGKGLEVTSTIRRMDGSEIYPTEENDIHVGSASTGNGTLIFNNDEGDTKARVDMYSKGFIDGEGVKNYQYIGTPFVEINALYNYYGSWIYSWGTKKNGNLGWVVVKNGGPMTAWTGYCITQEAPTYHQMSGTLTATGTVDITVPANANMVVGNSWTAPIDINALTTDDLEGLTANIYFFNTGVDKTGTAGAAGSRYAGSTYVTVPVDAARYEGEDDHINSLQGFFVKNPNGSAGTLHLDYERHVRKTTRDNILSDEMHAPARRTALSSDEPAVLKIKVSGENYDDKLLLLEREDFTEGFDNGWDGDKWDGNESALYIYTTDNNGTENSVSAIPELEGTVIGFRAGEDDAYTLNFEYLNSDEPLYLYDVENNTYTQIMTGMTYRFFTTDNEKHARFIITRTNGQEVATGVEPVSGSLDRSKAKKLLIEDKMFIMVNGMLYDATGKVVK